MITNEDVLDALRTVQDPELGQDLVSLSMIRDIQIEGEKIFFIHRGPHDPGLPAGDGIPGRCEEAVRRLPVCGTWRSPSPHDCSDVIQQKRKPSR